MVARVLVTGVATGGRTRAAYFHNLRHHSGHGGGMCPYRGGDSRTDAHLYDIDPHFDAEGG